MKTMSALTLVAALAISSAAFAQTNATNSNRADGASNTASPMSSGTGRSSDTGGSPAGSPDPAPMGAPMAAPTGTTGSGMTPPPSTGAPKVLQEDKNNEKSRNAN
ncbi:MAG: hypothetical protein JO254_08715 [Pseudolabrys sp.]|nr:hypothetical protein [Pseudolabrys sp.]